jgi:chromosome segregation ATPase
MKELGELEKGIGKLKRDSAIKKEIISKLETEKRELLKRSDELSERLNKTSESHREALARLSNSVNTQVNGLKMEMAELSNSLEGLSGLEKRLESQESDHEKTLSSLEKQLILVEKSLSDVERVKSELSRQRTSSQEFKLQLEKGLQAGIAYVRKEMEMNRREDAKAALEEFKQEIERIASIENELNSQKRSQSARIDSLTQETANLSAGLAEIRMLKERSRSLEELGGRLTKAVGDLTEKQKTASSRMSVDLTDRIQKGLGALKKELEARREEDLKTHLLDLKNELERVSSVEEGIKAHEKRIDRLAQDISSLEPVTKQVELIRDKVEESLHRNQSLAEATVTNQDFERATRSMSRRTEELENRFLMLDKRLSSDKNRIEKSILEILNDEKVLEGTQENLKKWFDSKIQNMEQRVSSGLDALTTQMEEGAGLVDRLRTRSQKMDLLTKDLPKRMEEQSRAVTRLLDTKASLIASLESLSGDITNLSGNLSGSLERIAALEKGLASVDKSKESRLDKMSALTSPRNPGWTRCPARSHPSTVIWASSQQNSLPLLKGSHPLRIQLTQATSPRNPDSKPSPGTFPHPRSR